MSSAVTSPYVGLRPFSEAEQAFFFGRERDISVIATNIIEEPLTVIYGPSGAGKSSVLQAGVLPHLKLLPNAAVVYVRNWQGDNFQEEIRKSVSAALGQPQPEGSLQDIVIEARKQLFLMLDQFEEYLLYHSAGGNGDRFETTLARIVNRSDIQARVLIGLREDGLSRLNERFGIRIPDLLGNTLQVERLNLSAARNAIRKPLEVFSDTPQAKGKIFSIEDSLVEEILDQVQEGGAVTSDFTGKGTRSSEAEAQIETAYLQLVLTKLWNEETSKDSTILRLATFRALGGANAIVRNHVRSVMKSLGGGDPKRGDDLREIAARLFVYLVTPSRTKIAQRTEDLVAFGEASEMDVRQVLNTLADQQETRILRRLSNPEQYEIFHDVLAQHILDWRRDREEKKRMDEQSALQKKQLEEQERRQKEEADRKQRELEQAQTLAREQALRAEQSKKLADEQELRANEQAEAARKLRHMVGILIILVMLAAAAAIYGFVEKKRGDRSAKAADENAKAAAASAELARSAQQESQANLNALKAEEARSHNDQAAAQQYQHLADENRKKADEAAKQAQQQGSAALSAAQQLKQVTDERDKLNAQLGLQQQDLNHAKADHDNLSKEIKTLQQQLDDLRASRANSTTGIQRPGKNSAQQTPPSTIPFDPKAVSGQWSFPTGQAFAPDSAAIHDASCIAVHVFNKTQSIVLIEKVSLELSLTSLKPSEPARPYLRYDGDQLAIAAEGSATGVYCDSAALSKEPGKPLSSQDLAARHAKFTVQLSGPNGSFTVNMTGPALGK